MARDSVVPSLLFSDAEIEERKWGFAVNHGSTGSVGSRSDSLAPRFFQPIHLVLELDRESAMVFEESGASAIGGQVLHQIEAVVCADRPEHALAHPPHSSSN